MIDATKIQRPPFEHPIMEMAWEGCLRWALLGTDEGPTEIRRAFEAETGHKIVMANSPIERMIDKATGFDGGAEAYFLAFLPWFNANVWGE